MQNYLRSCDCPGIEVPEGMGAFGERSFLDPVERALIPASAPSRAIVAVVMARPLETAHQAPSKSPTAGI